MAKRLRIPHNQMRAPLTVVEITGKGIKEEIRYLVCSKCKKSGGTLVKVDDHYEHNTCIDKYRLVRR